MPVVAVEDGLTNVRRALAEAGFEVTGMGREEMKRAQAVVISGLDVDVLQRQDIKTEVPVISAGGRSAAEVVEDLRGRLL
ncbi:MAG: YkuS family protein [Bacillota bacterium]|nr:YkuS family protein [Bacillota bacterium]